MYIKYIMYLLFDGTNTISSVQKSFLHVIMTLLYMINLLYIFMNSVFTFNIIYIPYLLYIFMNSVFTLIYGI